MSTPQLQIPGSFAIPALAPVYVDGIPVSLVSPGGARASGTEDFWSSEPRMPGDPASEQLTISLGQARAISYIALDLPRFPHTMELFWWDGSTWQPVLTPKGTPLRFVESGCVPSVVDNPAALGAGMNPYHYGAGHWAHHDEAVQLITASRLLLAGVRPAFTGGAQKFPVSPAGRVCPYPLGVRNLDFGMRVRKRSDVPWRRRHPRILSLRQPCTTSTDVCGSPVQVALRENRASDLLRGGTWRCAPQPCAGSVVNLYLDARDAMGNPQLIERFYLNPVTSGVNLNLYYSATPPQNMAFTGTDDPLLPSLLNSGGSQLPVAGSDGITFPGVPGWLTLAAQGAGTVASTPWWTAIEIIPAFSSSHSGTCIVADAGLLQLYFSGGTWAVALAGSASGPNQPSSATLASWAPGFAAGDRLQFAAGFDGHQFFAWFSLGSMALVPAELPVPPAPVFRFGGLQDVDPSHAVLPGNFTMSAWILKQEKLDLSAGVPGDLLAFAAGAGAYACPEAGGAPPPQNAVARFAPPFIQGTTCPWGFAGGAGSAYASCQWVPIQRDYTLARGYLEFDPVTAAAFRLEFTNLQPEPFDYFQPGGQDAQSFIQPAPAPGTASSPLDAGLTAGQAVAPTFSFADTPLPRASPAAGAVPATEALYAPDPQAAALLAARGGALYNFQPWQPPSSCQRTVAAGPSAYQQSSVPVTSRVAYFVALASIAMYRLDYTAAGDTGQYLETFAATDYIESSSLAPGGWQWQQGAGLISPANLAPGGATAQSVTLNSTSAVTGVQFATVQSDPVQLLADPDFMQAGFPTWRPAGDALPLAQAPVNAQLGTMVQVTRGASASQTAISGPLTWSYLNATYASWAALMGAVPAWGDFGLPPATSSMGGIAYTGPPVATSPGGRVYVAARVLSPAALSAPLYLQLLDGTSGMVIAEAAQAVSGGTVTEWFAGFTLGEGITSTSTWSMVAGDYPTWEAIATAAPLWNTIDLTVTPLGATVSAQLVQLASTRDTWQVDSIAVFQDPVVWSFSNDGGATWQPAYDIANNPRGAITFPAGTAGTQLRWQVTAYVPGVWVSDLAIRPWYATWPRGIPPRPAGIGHGPNRNPADQYPPIEQDPRWQSGRGPLPVSWYFAARQALGISSPAADFPGAALPPPDALLGDALVYEPAPAVPLAEPTYSGIYTDIYTDQYALADGGDIYTDTYCDVYGRDYAVLTGTTRSGAAALAAGASLSAPAVTVPLAAAGLGADLGPVQAGDASIAAWIAATGESLPVRRIALGNQIPASLAASPAAGDAGVRRVLFDFSPDATTTPAQLQSFLLSCQAGGLRAAVSLWSRPDETFSAVSDYLQVLTAYVPAIRQAAYDHVFAIGNDSVVAGALAAWYPGDELTDIISVFFAPQAGAPGSGGDTLAAAGDFAAAHGRPFGLAGFGADRVLYTPAQGEAYLVYVQHFFAGRRAAGNLNSDLIYLGTGSYSLAGAVPGLITAYQQIAAAL